MDLAIGILGAIQTILVDTILLLRLLAVYPRSCIGHKRWALLITLPIVLKLARVINLVTFIVALSRATQLRRVWTSAPCLKGRSNY